MITDGEPGRITKGGALCVVRGEFLCDICGLPGTKLCPTQKRHAGECAAEAKRRAAERREQRKRRNAA